MYPTLSNKSILVVDDDVLSNENLSYIFRKNFKNVISCFRGDEAYKSYLEYQPDLVLTDIEIPSIDGLTLIEKIRKRDMKIPIVVMTSFSQRHYLFDAVNLQLFFHIVKPVIKTNFHALLEKLEKYFLVTKPKPFFFSSLVYYDYAKKVIINDKKTVSLTHQEISLLEEFIRNKNITLSNQYLEDILSSKYSENSNAIKLSISRLRKKLPDNSLKTIYAQGYRLNTIIDKSYSTILLEYVNEKIAFIDKEYTYLAVNRTYLESFKKSENEIVGKKIEDILGKKGFYTVKKYIDRALSGETVVFDAWFELLEGKVFLHVTYQPHYEDNIFLGVIAIINDITKIKLLQIKN